MRNNIITGLLICVITGSLSAQDVNFPDLKGYKKNTDYPVYLPDNLWDYINGAADMYLSFGFKDLHVAQYKKGRNVIKIEIYRLDGSTMAFGIYSSERSPSFTYSKLGTQGYTTSDGSTNFIKGNYYVKIRTYNGNENVLKSAQSLAQQVASTLEGGTTLPQALSSFPTEGRKVNEETYINESVLGHQFLRNAFKVVYQTDNDVFAVYLIENKSVEDMMKTIEAYLTATKTEAADAESGRVMMKDGYNGTIYLAWQNNKVVIISGLSQDQSSIADRYTTALLK